MNKLAHVPLAVCLALLGCGDDESGAGSTTDPGSGGGGGAGTGGANAGGWGAGGGSAPTGPARIFFTDLQSGPNTGGEADQGAFVTLRGRGFGAAQGGSTVTVGGGEAVAYPIWSDAEVVVQLGSAAQTGEIVVHTALGDSNGAPFTVRSGHIVFVAPSGDDGADGSFANPFGSVPHAKDALQPGDIAYLMDGTTATAEENYGAALVVESSGTADAPKAIVAYPGATATIGSTALEFGARVPNNSGTKPTDWVFAGLTMRGAVQALDIGGDGASRWRVVGNDISCPVGDGQTGCFAAALASYITFVGNEVHGVSKMGSQPSKQYHAVYFTTDTNHVVVAYNHIHDNDTCRAIQFHSSPLGADDGYNQYDIDVHHNLVHGDVCDGIVLATVDPSKGPVRIHDNVIYDVGRGPAPPDGDANYSGIYVAGGTNTGPDGTGDVEIWGNTIYDCGRRKLLPGAIGDEGLVARGPGSPGLVMRLTNNIVVAVDGEDYVAPSSDTSLVTGTNNLWFGAGEAPSFSAASVAADPLFVDAAARDFHLTAASPAVDAGAAADPTWDFDGVLRPQGAAFDIGAFERAP